MEIIYTKRKMLPSGAGGFNTEVKSDTLPETTDSLATHKIRKLTFSQFVVIKSKSECMVCTLFKLLLTILLKQFT